MKSNKEAKYPSPLKQALEKVRADAIKSGRADKDPIRFARHFFDNKKSKEEVEAAALFSAMLSYGSAKQFIQKIEQVMNGCQGQFLKLITNPQKASKFDFPIYRLSTAKEIACFAKAIGRVITKYGSLKNVFLKGFYAENSTLNGLVTLREALVKEAQDLINPLSKGLLHLLSNPASGGCAKRWHMFLRWLVRPNDGVDMGLWHEVSPSELVIPLDLHISRIARNLSLTSRKANDLKTAIEITDSLREFCPEDPVKYDFSLCHLGISKSCDNGKTKKLCENCQIAPYCLKGQSK